jgi:predicted dehydrogenase
VGRGSIHDDVDAVWVLAPHDLAISLEVLGAIGPPEAAVGHWLGNELEHLSALLRGEGGWHVLEVSSRSPERRREIELHCDEGVAVLADGWDQHLTVRRDGSEDGEEERIETPGELPLLAELRAFVEHVRGGPPPRSSAADGAAIVSAIAELRSLSRAR